jgi:hypothetical protein
VALQTSQAAPHAVAQQTPSAQKPDWHCVGRAHGWPFPRAVTQAVPSHENPGAQPASLAHAAGHAALWPAHTNGAHAGLPAVPAGATVQVPGSWVHTLHGPEHGVSQHSP